MRKFILKFSVLVVLVMSALNCFANITQDGITYVNESGGLWVKSVDKNLSGEVVVPEAVDGSRVIGVLTSAFSGCGEITSVRFTFDKSLKDQHSSLRLRANVFAECPKLTKVVLPMLYVDRTDVDAFKNLPSGCTIIAGLNKFGYQYLPAFDFGGSPAQFKFISDDEVDSASHPSNVSVIKTSLDLVSRDFTTVVLRPTVDSGNLLTGILYDNVWLQGQDTYTLNYGSNFADSLWAGFNVDGYELFIEMSPWIKVNDNSLTYKVQATKSSLRFYNINFDNEGYSPSTYDLLVYHTDGNTYPVIDGEVVIPDLSPSTNYYFQIKAVKKDGTGSRDLGRQLEGTTKDLESTVTFSKRVSPTTILLTININETEDEKVVKTNFYLSARPLNIAGKKISDKGDVQKWLITGLLPDKSYDATVFYKISLKNSDESQGKAFADKFDLRTPGITLESLPAKVVSATASIVAASTNLDNDDSGAVETGFEWRKLDAPASLDSKVGVAPVSDGMIEGFVKNLQPTYYKFRPYCRYVVDSGETVYKYGDWETFDQTDVSYFEPSVRTYADVVTTCNTAVLRGYALAGSDNIIGQGFELWRKGSYNAPIRIPAVLSAPSGSADLITLEASGQIMEAQATDLVPGTEYAFRAYVKTDGGTFYGDEQSFTTDSYTGIEVISSADKEPVVTGIFDLTGHQVVGEPKGVVIIRYSDGTARKAIGGIR